MLSFHRNMGPPKNQAEPRRKEAVTVVSYLAAYAGDLKVEIEITRYS
jgi:hypothetical protein